MITRLASLPEEWRERRRYARLRRAMRKGTLLEVIGDFEHDDSGGRIEPCSADLPTGPSVRGDRLQP